MKVHIEFDTDNAAFEDDPKEVNRIMVIAMSKVDRAWWDYRVLSGQDATYDGLDEHLLDRNGNSVGFVKVTP